jgi:polyisoprenoid-binding protein YceI
MMKLLKRRRAIGVVAVVAIVVIAAGLWVFNDWFGFEGPRTSGVTAPTLEADASTQAVYRIDPAQSVVRYAVDEIFAGRPASTAVGTTRHIAGDIIIERGDLSRSQVGTIVINIEQFESDSGLRDRRIRREYLESSMYPEAVFVPREIIGLPSQMVEGAPYTFEMVGDLTIKETTHPVTWAVTATLDGEALAGSANTTLLMSAYGIGPIDIAGLVETADEVRLTLEFVAVCCP